MLLVFLWLRVHLFPAYPWQFMHCFSFRVSGSGLTCDVTGKGICELHVKFIIGSIPPASFFKIAFFQTQPSQCKEAQVPVLSDSPGSVPTYCLTSVIRYEVLSLQLFSSPSYLVTLSFQAFPAQVLDTLERREAVFGVLFLLF